MKELSIAGSTALTIQSPTGLYNCRSCRSRGRTPHHSKCFRELTNTKDLYFLRATCSAHQSFFTEGCGRNLFSRTKNSFECFEVNGDIYRTFFPHRTRAVTAVPATLRDLFNKVSHLRANLVTRARCLALTPMT